MLPKTELAIRIEELEAKCDSAFTELVGRIVADVEMKLRRSLFELAAFNSEVKGMDGSLKMLNGIVEAPVLNKSFLLLTKP